MSDISSDTDSSEGASPIGPLQVIANAVSSSSASSSASAARLGAVPPKSRSSLVVVPPVNTLSATVSHMASNTVPAANTVPASSAFVPVDSSSFLPAVSANSMGPSPTNLNKSSVSHLPPMDSSFDDVEVVVGEKIPAAVPRRLATATLKHVVVTAGSTNFVFRPPKKVKPPETNPKKLTKIKSIQGIHISELAVDDLRPFASRVGAIKVRGTSKKGVCDLIIEQVNKYENRQLAGGVVKVEPKKKQNTTVICKRYCNVVFSEAIRPLLSSAGASLGRHQLTAGIKTDKPPRKTSEYNNKDKYNDDAHPTLPGDVFFESAGNGEGASTTMSRSRKKAKKKDNSDGMLEEYKQSKALAAEATAKRNELVTEAITKASEAAARTSDMATALMVQKLYDSSVKREKMMLKEAAEDSSVSKKDIKIRYKKYHEHRVKTEATASTDDEYYQPDSQDSSFDRVWENRKRIKKYEGQL